MLATDDPIDRSTRPSWRAGGLAVAAVAAPLVLAAVGQAQVTAALATAVGLAVIAAAAARARPPSRGAKPSATPVPATPRAPPFSLMLEHLVDPILLIAGVNPGDVGDRRFVYANAAARDLLRIQRPEGPLTTAIRAPEILAAVEAVLFVGGARQTSYETRGVQERFWRAGVTALTDGPQDGGRERLALLTLRDETEVRRSERTRADFLANASHELRTPLASLAGFVETLRGHARDDPDLADVVMSRWPTTRSGAAKSKTRIISWMFSRTTGR